MDCGPPGSSVHGILQARTLEWVAIPSSPGDLPDAEIEPVFLCPLHWQAGSLPFAPPGMYLHMFYIYTYLFIYIFLATLRGTGDLSSQTRDQTHTPCCGIAVFTTGPPGHSQN